jgi:hypothetical protein
LKHDGEEARKRLEALGYNVEKDLAEFYLRLEGMITRNA